VDGWQFIMLDSYDPGHVGGRLTPNELARLDDALARSPKHAMVCLHHHPIFMGSRWLDTVGLTDPEAFWRVIDAHRHVRAVVWGHVHQVYDGQRGDVRLFATPSTGAQFLPKSDRYAVDTRPPAYRRFDLFYLQNWSVTLDLMIQPILLAESLDGNDRSVHARSDDIGEATFGSSEIGNSQNQKHHVNT